jgi:predicted DCC family thiol-disulfide oxidoreductase YuxK
MPSATYAWLVDAAERQNGAAAPTRTRLDGHPPTRHAQRMRPDTLLIDGDCGLCRAAGDWLAAHVDADAIRVMELQSVRTEPGLAERVDGLRLGESLTLVRAVGEVRRGAAAVIGAGRQVPVLGLGAALYDHRLGHALWEPAYRLVAANRHRIGRALGIPAVCATIPG